MELDLQNLSGLHVRSFTHWLRPRTPPPRIWAHIRRRYLSAKIDDISLRLPAHTVLGGQTPSYTPISNRSQYSRRGLQLPSQHEKHCSHSSHQPSQINKDGNTPPPVPPPPPPTPVLRIRDVYPESRIRIFPSRIPG